MSPTELLKEQIRKAFTVTCYPGDSDLRGSSEGDEPFRVEREFCGKCDWQSLAPEFIDLSPGGLGSALNFFSNEAFRFYLPAYLMADIDGKLDRSNPIFQLTHGLERRSARRRINPQRYGDQTWNEYARERFAAFTSEEAAAIVAYLEFKRDADEWNIMREEIDEALGDYWLERACR